jgi:hypothetical protein
VVDAVVLDIVREKQRSGSARQKNRAGSKWGASGKTWFLLDTNATIRVAVDKAEQVASETTAVEVDGRWHGSVAARGEHSDEATVHTLKRWVRLTDGPSPNSDFSQDF